MSSQSHDPSEPTDTSELASPRVDNEVNVDTDVPVDTGVPVWPDMLVRSEAEELFPEDEIDKEEKEKDAGS